MIGRLREMTTAQVMRLEIQTRPDEDLLPDEDDLPMMAAHHLDATTGEDDVGEGLLLAARPTAKPGIDPKNPATWGKLGRNDPCPCGSGKKYKHCHGAYA